MLHSQFGAFNNAPIPGQSLTRTPQSSPTQQPPQFADVNDALEYMWGQLTDKRQLVRLTLLLKHKVPVEFIARAVLFTGFTKGKWTPDTALLMLKTTMRMIAGIAKLKGIKVKMFNPDKEQDDFLDNFANMTPPEDDTASASTDSAPKFTGVLGGNL